MSKLFVYQPPFPFQVWPDLKCNQDSADSLGSFASTYPLMLFSISPRDALLACSSSPPWNVPSFTVESTLSTRCSRSDPLSFSKVGLLLTLTLSHLTIWYFGQTALLRFLLAKAAPRYLPTALSVALRPLFSFQQAQYAQIFPLKPVPFCKFFAGLGSPNKFAISRLFFSYPTLALSSPPSFLLP